MSQKVSIITLGCAKNVSDTDNLTRVLKHRGHQIVQDAGEADTIVVHTCSFIEAAKKESINTILDAGKLKAEGKTLIVTGCLVQQHGQEIFDEMPEVDAFLGTGQLSQVAGLLDKPHQRFIDRANPGGFMDPDAQLPNDVQSLSGVQRRERRSGSERRPDSERRSVSAYLRLSEGCSHPCSFCVIPRLRGPVQSRSEETILREARQLAAAGVEEISIIGQDTGDWGRDVKGRSQKAVGKKKLPNLLRALGQIDGIRWIRLMYMHPASFTDELLAVFAEQPDKFPYLDMPLQHIDTAMLSEMRRLTDEAGIRALLERIHKRVPSLTLRTTFIVGHPGETAAQFNKLLNFVKEGHFDYLGAFGYSKEEGTRSAKRKGQISDKVKQNRLGMLTNAYYEVAHAKARYRIGTKETVILEDTEGDTVVGRTRREAPEIDAIVRLPSKAVRKGRFITAKITGYDAYEFTAVPQ